MSKITQTSMMRKTKAVLVEMLEQQRTFIAEANKATDQANIKVARNHAEIGTLQEDICRLEGKYEHLKTKHESLNREFTRLEKAYIDKMEIVIELYERLL